MFNDHSLFIADEYCTIRVIDNELCAPELINDEGCEFKWLSQEIIKLQDKKKRVLCSVCRRKE